MSDIIYLKPYLYRDYSHRDFSQPYQQVGHQIIGVRFNDVPLNPEKPASPSQPSPLEINVASEIQKI